MEPEEIKKNKRKIILITILGSSLVIIGVICTVFYYNYRGALISESSIRTETPKEPTEAEKLQMLVSLASSTPKDTALEQEEKLKILQNLAKNAPAVTPTETAERLRALQALASSTKQ